MTDAQLLAAIDADPQAKALADAGNDAGCAARLTAVLPPVVSSKYLTEAGILRVLGASAGNALLSSVEALAAGNTPNAPVLARIVRFIREIAGGGIDFGNAEVRAMLDQLAGAGALNPASVAKLKAVAEEPASVDHGDVSRVYLSRRPGGIVGGK